MRRFDEEYLKPLAHSARNIENISAQTYAGHLSGVVSQAVTNAENIRPYAKLDGMALLQTVKIGSAYHDLGKLDPDNQKVLRGEVNAKNLPIQHCDAGSAFLIKYLSNALSACLVYSHHIGLPDFVHEQNRGDNEFFRDNDVKNRVDNTLDQLIAIHNNEFSCDISPIFNKIQGNSSIFFRLALSCLVDADHSDTANHYQEVRSIDSHILNPHERIKCLDKYIKKLSGSYVNNRNDLRNKIYTLCRNSTENNNMYSCDSPVGTGKTTSIMAHLLNYADRNKLRRIFVVLPFTNIIDQSVDVYRKSLVLPGEEPENIIAAHHHKADFDTLELRQYSYLWQAPVIVTTAVQFFETLASNRPATLRKLHQLPGSAIFIDEAHAALPVHLWPQAWKWLKELSENWGCHFVFGSGSLNRFWELEEFQNPPKRLPELIDNNTRKEGMLFEENRINYIEKKEPLHLEGLINWQNTLPGPRLLIVNTVQSAAIIADKIKENKGRKAVEHLSTSLCPQDRKKTLSTICKRLSDCEDKDWTLVATSCVEAGMDFSFRTAMRERACLNSLIQIGGRVNRKGEYDCSDVWDFRLLHNGLLVANPAFDVSAMILGQLFQENKVSPLFSTEAMRREIRLAGIKKLSDEIVQAEINMKFPDVNDKFKVISSNTFTVVVDEHLKQKLKSRIKLSSNDIQNGSVQIWSYKKDMYDLQEISMYPQLKFWNLPYDNFLGYMAGVLPIIQQQQNGYSII